LPMLDKKPSVLILSLVPFLMVLGNSMLIPEFPAIKEALKIDQFQVGLLITFFSAAAALAIPFLGYLSDRIGRKIIIVPALLLYGLGGAASGFAAILLENPYGYILAGRVVQGLGAAGTAPLAMTLAGDLLPDGERSWGMGTLEAGNGIGKVFSPIIGSAVALIIWYALFFSYAILSIPVALLIWFLVQEKQGEDQGVPFKKYISDMKDIFDKKGVSLLLTFGGGLVILFILFGVLSYTSDILVSTFKLKGIIKGLVLSIPLLTMSILAYLSGLYLKRKGRNFKLFFLLGLVIAAVAMGILPFCNRSLIVYPLVLAVLGFGSGMMLPAVNTMVTSSTKSSRRGGVTSLYGSIRFLGVALGPPTFSLLFKGGVYLMFFSGGVLALLAGITGFLFINEDSLLK
jgi:ACDE family multidrug resistance protein